MLFRSAFAVSFPDEIRRKISAFCLGLLQKFIPVFESATVFSARGSGQLDGFGYAFACVFTAIRPSLIFPSSKPPAFAAAKTVVNICFSSLQTKPEREKASVYFAYNISSSMRISLSRLSIFSCLHFGHSKCSPSIYPHLGHTLKVGVMEK